VRLRFVSVYSRPHVERRAPAGISPKGHRRKAMIPARDGFHLSVSSASDSSIQELARPEYELRRKQIGVTTVGQIRAIGGRIERNFLQHNPFHGLVANIAPAQASTLLTPTQQNPKPS
jgi:hypothetical protein